MRAKTPLLGIISRSLVLSFLPLTLVNGATPTGQAVAFAVPTNSTLNTPTPAAIPIATVTATVTIPAPTPTVTAEAKHAGLPEPKRKQEVKDASATASKLKSPKKNTQKQKPKAKSQPQPPAVPVSELDPELDSDSEPSPPAPSPKSSRPYTPSISELLVPALSPARTSNLTPGEAAIICRMPGWALTTENWIFSGAKDWLEEYTLATQGDFLRARYGLVGSIAYRFLGEENFRCSVGMTQSCVVWCKDVVMAVEDLEEARVVYFALSSIAHLAAVTDLIHDGLALAQNNVGLMAPKMAFSFFWSPHETDADKLRFMLHLTLTGIQQIFQFLSPFIPLVKVLEDLHTKFQSFDADLARRLEMEHYAWLFMRTAVMFDSFSAHEWPGTLKSQQEPQQQLGFYAHITGMRGDRGNDYFGYRPIAGEKRWWLYQGRNRLTEKRPDGRAWKGGNNNILDRITKKGWRRREAELFAREGGPAHPPSHEEYSWKGIFQEENEKVQALKTFKEEADKSMLQMRNNAYRMGWSVFTGWLPEIFIGVNNWLAWEEDENSQDINAAYLAMKIQETTREARKELKKSFDLLMDPSEVAPDGETLLSYTIGLGHYLPPNDDILKSFTAHDVEEKITKNIFHKALNTALKAQKVYITCTPDIQKRDEARSKSGPEASSCSKDNTGPEDLKACVTITAEESLARGLGNESVELVCYMYKWATRGDVKRHYNERPFGSDTWEVEWGVSPQDIITSSVKSHIAGLDDTSLVVSTDSRPSPETLADPSVAGIFTIPVCISRHNWNNGIRDFGTFDKLSPHTSKKNLPCSCGFWGGETEQVWRDIGIWDSNNKYYRTELCPAQRRKHMDELEKYVNSCRLETRKAGVGYKLGKDGMCPLVSDLLETLLELGFSEKLTRECSEMIWCRVQNGLLPDKACKKVPTDTPFSTILEQLDNKVIRQPAVPEAIKKMKGSKDIADGLYSMSLTLGLVNEVSAEDVEERRIPKKERPSEEKTPKVNSKGKKHGDKPKGEEKKNAPKNKPSPPPFPKPQTEDKAMWYEDGSSLDI